MDLFDLQAEFASHWLGLLGLSAETALNAGASLANSAVPSPSEPQSNLSSPSHASVASLPCLADPFQFMQVFAPKPFDLSSSWTAWPMTQLPWGQLPWAQVPSFLAMMPWSFGRTFDPWSFGAGAWPVGGIGGSMAMFGLSSAWGGSSSGYGTPFFGWPPAAPTAADVLEQVAATYRSAGGHAVAMALAPMRTPQASSNCGQWWPSPARYASF